MAVPITFGKHKGKTVEWVFFNDPGYIYWMVDNNVRLTRDPCFQRLLRRAAHLKIPGICIWCKKKPISRMIAIRHPSGGLTDIGWDCEDCNPGGSGWIVLTPSFKTPDCFRGYDKTGAKTLIRAIKYAYFGDSSHRMTKKRLEEFWENDDNFVNP